MSLTLVVLAAGSATRYGGQKQLVPVGPSGETLLEYAIYDAIRAGFLAVVLVVRPEAEPAFRDRMRARVGDAIPVSFVHQRLDDLPGAPHVFAGREKPWGTAHAVLAAERAVAGAFVVGNADDYYGPSAYGRLAEHFRSHPLDTVPHALVTYRLDDTLSPHGGVSRAVCTVDADDMLRGVVELKEIQRMGGALRGVRPDGTHHALDGSESVSMNLWGFTPAVFASLRAQLGEFVTALDRHPTAEFFLSTALHQQVVSQGVRVRILPGGAEWYGMTFPSDRDRVAAGISRLVERGVYPADLASWFHSYHP
jgi:hypothetical protein